MLQEQVDTSTQRRNGPGSTRGALLGSGTSAIEFFVVNWQLASGVAEGGSVS